MANAAAPDPRGWAAPALLVVGAVTALRVWALWVSPTDLFVDEAQYWLWAQGPAFGYYSKPPMIAWVIWLSTLGSDAPFWVRLPAPLLHAATALILGRGAASLWGASAGAWTAAAWVLLPMAAVGSFMISTDTVMFPFLALALLAWLAVLRGGGRIAALAAGACLGLAALSKYAALYYVLAAGVAAFWPVYRPRGREALVALAALVVVLAPNLIWNLLNGLATVQHTLDNADWVRDPAARAALDPLGWLSFLLEQFAVFGPLTAGGLVWLGLTLRRRGERVRLLAGTAIGIVLLVSVQALLSRAYANWAASAYVAGTLAVIASLSVRWRAAAVVVNAALCLLVLVAVAFPERLPRRLAEAMDRYQGRAAMSRAILAEAGTRGLRTIVATDRDILADLFYTGGEAGVAFRALAGPGRPDNHYALAFPYRSGAEPVLFVTRPDRPPACEGAEPLGPLEGRGYWQDRRRALWSVPGDCWAP